MIEQTLVQRVPRIPRKRKNIYITGRGLMVYHKGDILLAMNGSEMLVTRVYRKTWWRKVLRRIGFHTKEYSVRVRLLVK